MIREIKSGGKMNESYYLTEEQEMEYQKWLEKQQEDYKS